MVLRLERLPHLLVMTEVRAVILHAVHQEHRHLDPVDVRRAGACGAIGRIRSQRIIKVLLAGLRPADVAELVHLLA